jgi:DNA invertase Pin-like site-specific DNA recombinase
VSDFISYRENIDTTTSMVRLIFHINSAYVEFEREIIRDRVKAGIKAKRKKNNSKWGRGKLASAVQEKIQKLVLKSFYKNYRNRLKLVNKNSVEVFTKPCVTYLIGYLL